jgi:hypothetical protein
MVILAEFQLEGSLIVDFPAQARYKYQSLLDPVSAESAAVAGRA